MAVLFMLREPHSKVCMIGSIIKSSLALPIHSKIYRAEFSVSVTLPSSRFPFLEFVARGLEFVLWERLNKIRHRTDDVCVCIGNVLHALSRNLLRFGKKVSI